MEILSPSDLSEIRCALLMRIKSLDESALLSSVFADELASAKSSLEKINRFSGSVHLISEG